MDTLDTGELVLVHLASHDVEGERPPSACTPAGICEALGADAGLSDRFAVLSTLEGLADEGLVTQEERSVRGRSTGSVVTRLTSAGAERAAELRERLAALEVRVAGPDGPVERPLLAVADDHDREPVAILSAVSADGVYYPEERAPRTTTPGRSAERSAIKTAVETATGDGPGQFVLLTGPGGIGKTTVARAALEEDASDLPIVWERARCGQGDAAYGVLRELASRLGGAQTVFADDDPRTGPSGDPAVEDDPDGMARRGEFFAELTEVLEGPPDGPTRVLVLDDLHQLDRGTGAYLEYLLERLEGRSLVVIGCLRPGEVPPTAPASLRRPGEAVPEKIGTVVALYPLDLEPTGHLIETIVGTPGPPGEFVTAVHERTGGVPQYVEELVATLLETDQLEGGYRWYPAEPGEMDVPETVVETIQERLGALEEEALAVLQWAAIVGNRVDERTLRAVCDVEERRLRSILELLVDGGVMDRVEAGALEFRGQFVREAILAELPSDERERRHAAVAGALADDGAEHSDHGRIARHYAAAGDHDRAARHHRRAGAAAAAVYAYEEAIEHLERAVALSMRHDVLEPATLALALGDLAEAALITGDADAAREYLREATREVPARSRAEGELLALRAEAELRQSEFDRARESARTLQDIGQHLEDSELLARAARLLGAVAERQGQFDMARGQFDRCAALARSLESPELELQALKDLGTVHLHRDEYEDGRRHFQRCRELAAEEDHRRTEAKAIHLLGAAAYYESDYARADDQYRKALEIRREIGDRAGEAAAFHALGLNAFERGEFDRATEYYEQSIEISRAIGDTDRESKSLGNLALVSRRRGEYDRARQAQRRVLSISRELGARHREAKNLHNLAGLDRLQGTLDRAAERFHESLAMKRAIEDRRGIANSTARLAEVSIRQDEDEAAREYLETSLDIACEIGHRRGEAIARRNLARLAARDGDHDAARAHLEAVRERLAELGEPFDRAETDLVAARLARRRGDLDRAEEMVRRAEDGFAKLDARHWVARAQLCRGRIERDRGAHEQARRSIEGALETFEAVGAAHDALAALRDRHELAETEECRRTLRRRGEELLAAVSPGIAERHRDWVDERNDA